MRILYCWSRCRNYCANRLAQFKSKSDILIVDAGDFRNKKFFDLFEIRSEGSQIRGDSLHYGFGGASNVWGGLCFRYRK